MRILLKGVSGRMGQAIEKHLKSFPFSSEVEGRRPEESTGRKGRWEITNSTPLATILVDFSVPQAADDNILLALDKKIPILIGTTGLSEQTIRNAKEASLAIPVMLAPNTSIGSNLQRSLIEKARQVLPDSDVEIVDIHHNKKRDCPSGTALWLAEGIHGGKGPSSWRDGERKNANEIGVFGLRGGNTAGEHTVYLFNGDERIEITHRVYDRSVFAEGALRAASFLNSVSPGWYTMQDVLK